MIRIQRTIDLDVPAAMAWRILGEEFDRIGEWATPVPKSKAQAGDRINDEAPVAGRVCETSIAGFPAVTETITAYDADSRTLELEVTAGMPGFVTDVRNSTRIEALGPDRSQVTLDTRIKLRGLGRLMAPLMRFNLSRAIDQTMDDLRHYAETGEISERKRRSLKKRGEPVPSLS